VTAPHRVGEVERIGLGMRLAASRVGKGDALHDEAARRGGLRRGNEIARAFGADAGIVRIGGGDARLVELARQIGELNGWTTAGFAAPTAIISAGASKTSSTAGTTPARASSLAVAGRARHAGDLVPGAKEQRHQAAGRWRRRRLRGILSS